MENNVNLKRLVESVRLEFEQKSIPKEKLAKLYYKYNKEVNVDDFVNEAEKIFPQLNCGLASVYLQELFGGIIKQGKYLDNNHTYLLLKNKVIDITADQYGGPKVYVGELKFPWK